MQLVPFCIIFINHCLSKYGLWTGRFSITWELIGNENLRLHPWPTESNSGFKKVLTWFICTLEIEKYCILLLIEADQGTLVNSLLFYYSFKKYFKNSCSDWSCSYYLWKDGLSDLFNLHLCQWTWDLTLTFFSHNQNTWPNGTYLT